MSTNEPWGVLIADVVASREISGFSKRRKTLLEDVQERQKADGLLHSAYAVSGYDEFQGLATRPWALPRLIWELRRDFHPWELRIGCGIGDIDAPPAAGETLNEASTGDAFYRARETLSHLDEGKDKFERRTRLESGRESLDLAVNLAYELLDSLVGKTTDRQWETIRSFERFGTMDKTANDLGIDTVDRID